jgi:hypothetical protein
MRLLKWLPSQTVDFNKGIELVAEGEGGELFALELTFKEASQLMQDIHELLMFHEWGTRSD